MLGKDEGPEGASGARGSALPRRADFGVPLETKLYPPGLRKEWVERQNLIAQLSDSTAKLILVDAPAGFGKTTLVAQWRACAVPERRFAWVSLDRGDNDPARLWRHIVGALQKAVPELDGASLWQRPQDVLGTLLPLLVNALAAAAGPAARQRRPDRDPGQGTGVHTSTGGLVRARGRRGRAQRLRRGRPGGANRRLAGRHLHGRAVAARAPGPGGVHPRVHRKQPVRGRLPDRGGAEPPAASCPAVPDPDVHPRPVHRPAV